jgi:hypothetical protein
MADPNHTELLAQIRCSELEIEALANRIASANDSAAFPSDFAAMRVEQEVHRKRIMQWKSEIDQPKYAE